MIGGALISELKTVVDGISSPFVYLFTTAHPVDTTADFWKIVYAAMCILLYSAVIIFPFTCVKAIRHVRSQIKGTEENLEVNLYSEEISSTLDVLANQGLTDAQKGDQLEDFLRGIANNITHPFTGTSLNTIRYSFILSQPNTDNKEYYTVRLGRNGPLTADDNKVIEWVLTNTDDDFYVNADIKSEVHNVSAGYRINSVGLIRNSGTDFRLGFVIFFEDQQAFSRKERMDQFIVNSSAIRLFAHMDKLWESMVQYSNYVTSGGGGN